MYRIANFVYAVEWFVLTLFASATVFIAVRKVITGSGLHIDPFWLKTLPPLVLLLAVPLYLAFRRSRSLNVAFEPDFRRRSSVAQVCAIGLILIGCIIGALLFAIVVVPLFSLGGSAADRSAWLALAGSTLLLGGTASLLALGIGSLILEVLHISWLRSKRRMSAAQSPSGESHV